MTDPIKDDATAALADIKAETSKLDSTWKADELKVKAWFEHYQVWIVGGIAFIVGGLLGHFV